MELAPRAGFYGDKPQLLPHSVGSKLGGFQKTEKPFIIKHLFSVYISGRTVLSPPLPGFRGHAWGQTGALGSAAGHFSDFPDGPRPQLLPGQNPVSVCDFL